MRSGKYRGGIALFLAAGVGAVLVPGSARAQDRAVVDVGRSPKGAVADTDVRFAEPPPRYAQHAQPPVIASERSEPGPEALEEELYRAPVRFHVGPVGATTGRGLGLGLGLAADMGRGSVGFRLAAAWVRGEPSGADTSTIADGLSQYSGELTLDLRKRGPWHPLLGVGFGVARVNRGDGGGYLGVGTARLGLEYALGLDDADVRFGGGITGVLPGPADQEVRDVKGWALVGATVGIGF
jgi:hypothetical protein